MVFLGLFEKLKALDISLKVESFNKYVPLQVFFEFLCNKIMNANVKNQQVQVINIKASNNIIELVKLNRSFFNCVIV